MIDRQVAVNDLLQIRTVVCNRISAYLREIDNKLAAVF